MFQSALSNCVLLLLVPGIVRITSGANLAELGIQMRNWPRQVGLGARAAMLMTPPVCAIQFLAIQIWAPQAHLVEQMVFERFTLGVAILAILSTMVLAPCVEELLFRGIFQSWLDRHFEDSQPPAATVAEKERPAFQGLEDVPLVLVSTNSSEDSTPTHTGTGNPLIADHPNDPPWSHSSNIPILLTSVFFASLHLPQWPAPIAIFLLSLALGVLYKRTGSLMASIAMHATFNGINTLLLLIAALERNIQPPM